MKARLAKNSFGVVLILNGVILLNMGCSSATNNLGSLGDPLERISVQRAPAAGVSITRTKEEDKYDFYISLLDELGSLLEPISSKVSANKRRLSTTGISIL